MSRKQTKPLSRKKPRIKVVQVPKHPLVNQKDLKTIWGIQSRIAEIIDDLVNLSVRFKEDTFRWRIDRIKDHLENAAASASEAVKQTESEMK